MAIARFLFFFFLSACWSHHMTLLVATHDLNFVDSVFQTILKNFKNFFHYYIIRMIVSPWHFWHNRFFDFHFETQNELNSNATYMLLIEAIYSNCVFELYSSFIFKNIFKWPNQKKESITLSCLGLMVCFSSDSPDTGNTFGARQKWLLKVIYEVELQTP